MKALRIKTIVVPLLAGVVFMLSNCAVVIAVSAEYTQAYNSDEPLSFGTLVSLKDLAGDTIEPATISNSRKFLGVYVEKEGATVAVTKPSGDYQVAVSGSAISLVSNISGDIREGDLVAPSVISGVAGKFSAGNNVIGVALSDFDRSDPKNTKVDVVLTDGSKKQAIIGPLAIELFAIKNGVEPKPDLIGWVERLSGKPVSSFKIVSALVLTVLLIGSVTIMAYSAIRNTIVQSSRNPLANRLLCEPCYEYFS